MRVTVGELRRLIREGLGGSHPSEAYDKDLADDPVLKRQSVLVPDDIKRAIRKWSRAMGLTRRRKKRSRSAK
jgi:hypothetical protein